MSVDRGIASSASEVLSLPVRNMLAVSLNISFGQAKVNDEDLVAGLIESHTEVVRLDVTVDEVSIVDILNPRYHLVNQH